jgi:hypothetical protein
VADTTTTPYAAAVELCRAADTYRILARAGRLTETDVLRVDACRRTWDGLPPRRRRGPDQPVSVPELDLSYDGACGASLSARCFNGAAGCRVHR